MQLEIHMCRTFIKLAGSRKGLGRLVHGHIGSVDFSSSAKLKHANTSRRPLIKHFYTECIFDHFVGYKPLTKDRLLKFRKFFHSNYSLL